MKRCPKEPYKGSETSNDAISIYAYQVKSENDELNVWPLYGKQITIGIVEVGNIPYVKFYHQPACWGALPAGVRGSGMRI